MSQRRPQNLAELIRLCRDGHEQAWHELIDLVAPVIFSLCRKSRLSRDESFDIFGQVCLELVNDIGSLRSADRLTAFVATITRRQIYSFYKKMQVLEALDEAALRTVTDPNAVDPEQLHESEKRNRILAEALLILSEKEAQLLKALFFDRSEPSYQEIASRLGMPVSSIGPTRGKALTKLYRTLKRKKFEI